MGDVFLELVEPFPPCGREDEDVQYHMPDEPPGSNMPDELLGFNEQFIEIVAEHVLRNPHTLPRIVVDINPVERQRLCIRRPSSELCGDFYEEVQPSYLVGDEDEVQVVTLPIPRHAPEEFHAVNVPMAHENLCHLFRLRTVDENWVR